MKFINIGQIYEADDFLMAKMDIEKYLMDTGKIDKKMSLQEYVAFLDLAKAVYVDEKGVCPFGVFKTNNETYVHYTGETTDLNFESIERMVNKYISKNVEPIDLLEMFNSLKSEPDYPYLILEVKLYS